MIVALTLLFPLTVNLMCFNTFLSFRKTHNFPSELAHKYMREKKKEKRCDPFLTENYKGKSSDATTP